MPSPSSAISPVPGRVKIALHTGRQIIVEGGGDMDAVLKLARGLERSSDPGPGRGHPSEIRTLGQP